MVDQWATKRTYDAVIFSTSVDTFHMFIKGLWRMQFLKTGSKAKITVRSAIAHASIKNIEVTRNFILDEVLDWTICHVNEKRCGS